MNYVVVALLILVGLTVFLTLVFRSKTSDPLPETQQVKLLGTVNGVLQSSHEIPILTNSLTFRTIHFSIVDDHVGKDILLPKIMNVDITKPRGRLPNVQITLNSNVKLGHTYRFIEPQSSINREFKMRLNSTLPFLFKNKLYQPTTPQRGHRKLGFNSTRGIYIWQLPGEGHIQLKCEDHAVHGRVYTVECPGRNFRGDDDSIPPTVQNISKIIQECSETGEFIFGILAAPETGGSSIEAAEAAEAEAAAEQAGAPTARGGAMQTLKDFANCGNSIYKTFDCLFGANCSDSNQGPQNPPLTNQDIINDVNKVFQNQIFVKFSQSLNYTYETVFGSRNLDFPIDPQYSYGNSGIMPSEGFNARSTIPIDNRSLYVDYYSNQFNDNINDFESFEDASFSFYKKEYAEQVLPSTQRITYVFGEDDEFSGPLIVSSPQSSDPGLVNSGLGYRASLTVLGGGSFPTFGFSPSVIITNSLNETQKLNGCLGSNFNVTNSVICNGLNFANSFLLQVSTILQNRSSQNSSGGLICTDDPSNFSADTIPCPDYISSVLPSYMNIMRYYFNLTNDMAQFNTSPTIPPSVLLTAPGPNIALGFNSVQMDMSIWLRNAILLYYLQRQKYLNNIYWEVSDPMQTNRSTVCYDSGCNDSGGTWFQNNNNCSNDVYYNYMWTHFSQQIQGAADVWVQTSEYNLAYSMVNGNYNSFSSSNNPTSIPYYLFNSSYPFAFSNPTQFKNIPFSELAQFNSQLPPGVVNPQTYPFLFSGLGPSLQGTDGSNFIQNNDGTVSNATYVSYGISNRYFCNYYDADIQDPVQRQAILNSVRQSLSDHYDFDQGIVALLYNYAQSYGLEINGLTSLSFSYSLNNFSNLTTYMTTESGGISLKPAQTYTENSFIFNMNMTPAGSGKNAQASNTSYFYPRFLSDPILFDDSATPPSYGTRFDTGLQDTITITEFDVSKYSQSSSPQYLMFNTTSGEFVSLTDKVCCYGFTGYLLGASLMSISSSLTSNTARTLYCGNSLIGIGNSADSPLIAPMSPVLNCPADPIAVGSASLLPLKFSNLVPLSFTSYIGTDFPAGGYGVVQTGLTKPSLALSGLNADTSSVFFDTGIPLKTNYTGDYVTSITNASRTGNFNLGLWGDFWNPFASTTTIKTDTPPNYQNVGWSSLGPIISVYTPEGTVATVVSRNFIGYSSPSNGSESFWYSYNSVSLRQTGGQANDLPTQDIQQPNLYNNKFFENNAAGFQSYYNFQPLAGFRETPAGTSTQYVLSLESKTQCDAGTEYSTLYPGNSQSAIGNFPQQFSYNFQVTFSTETTNTFTTAVVYDGLPRNFTQSATFTRNSLLLSSYTYGSSSFNSTIDEMNRNDIIRQTGICINSISSNCPTGSTFELYDFDGNALGFGQTITANSSFTVRVYEFLTRAVTGTADYGPNYGPWSTYRDVLNGLPPLFRTPCPYQNSRFESFNWQSVYAFSNGFRGSRRIIQTNTPNWTIGFYS
jgi:hypothetical protein